MNTILQVHFIVALLNGYIKIKNEESTIEAVTELSGSSSSGSSSFNQSVLLDLQSQNVSPIKFSFLFFPVASVGVRLQKLFP